jgi:hypothetical protein
LSPGGHGHVAGARTRPITGRRGPSCRGTRRAPAPAGGPGPPAHR